MGIGFGLLRSRNEVEVALRQTHEELQATNELVWKWRNYLVEESPLTWLEFGESNKNARQVRVTDSSFRVSEMVDDTGVEVDKKANEFIKNFYKELKMQEKRFAIKPFTP
ncbi:putative LRR receptor-like serine/threonine-protein kinase GSO1-like protein [Tanacetum coccineum]